MPEVSDRDYKRIQSLKQKGSDENPFSYSAASGKVMSFSAPGVTNFKVRKLEKSVELPRQIKKKPDKPADGVTGPVKPKKQKDKQGTVADVEAAVRKGYVLPEEATGSAGVGATGEKWFESEGFDSSGKQIYGKPTKIDPISKNYATKLGKAQAQSQATGTPLGKQFTGPSSMKLSMGPKAGFNPYPAPVNLDEFNK